MKIMRFNRSLQRFSWLILALGLLNIASHVVLAADSAPSGPLWSRPTATALKRIAPQESAQNEPNFLNNLDCSLMTYRQVGSGTMQSGCFTATAFGWLDSDSETVIFNGTDEGLPLLPFSPHQVIAPWPNALNVIALDATVSTGSYISLYKNPTAMLKDQRDLLGILTAKQLRGPPEIPLVDDSGQRLVINPQSLAFSDGGGWLVAETMSGYFVRINLATLQQTVFAPAFGSQGSPALLKSKVTISDDGRFVAIENDVASSFKVYDLASCPSTKALTAGDCQANEYWPFIAQQVPGAHSLRHLRFVNNGLLSFSLTATDPSASGLYELAPATSIDSLIDYLGLGDSYTSGEGAYDYLAGSDTSSNMCHLSIASYPLLITHDLFNASSGHNVACSGAKIRDISDASPQYRGQVSNAPSTQQLKADQPELLASVITNFLPGYVPQQSFAKTYQPRNITISVGGDDIGFGELVETCVMPRLSLHLSSSDCFNSYEARLEFVQLIDKTIPRWQVLFRQLHGLTPKAQLYVVDYPKIISDTGSCGLNVHLSKNEAELALELTDYLNSAMQQAAEEAQVSFVDVSDALMGHRLCEAKSAAIAVNGLTAGTDAGLFGIQVLGKESYHPNALGQRLLESAILQQTNHFASPQPTRTLDNSIQKLLDAPKSGRKIYARSPSKTITTKLQKRGARSKVTINGLEHGLVPGTSYDVHLDGPDGPSLGSIISDSNSADVSGDVSLPASSVGGHTLDVIGNSQVDQPVDIVEPIYIENDLIDGDGDGLPDTVDSCIYAVNSGIDADHDGTDDACDGNIDLSISGNSSADGNSSNGQTSGSGSELRVPTSPTAPSGSPATSNAPNAASPQVALPVSTLQDATHPQTTLAQATNVVTVPNSLIHVGYGTSLATMIRPPRPIVKTGHVLGVISSPNFKHKPKARSTGHADLNSTRPGLSVVHWQFWTLLIVGLWWLILLVVLLIRRLSFPRMLGISPNSRRTT